MPGSGSLIRRENKHGKGATGAGCRRYGRPWPGDRSHGMTAVSAPRPGWDTPGPVVSEPSDGTRRCAPACMRAPRCSGPPMPPAYTRSALASLVRDLRAGKVTVFAPPGVPGRFPACQPRRMPPDCSPCSGLWAQHRRTAAHRRRGPSGTAALRGGLGAPVRRRPHPGLLRQDHPPPAQPRR